MNKRIRRKKEAQRKRYISRMLKMAYKHKNTVLGSLYLDQATMSLSPMHFVDYTVNIPRNS